MKNLKAKLRRDGGFTLVEMLIVVAIIAILVAVSIPVIGSALESARDATDRANERAAKAEAVIIYLGATNDGPAGYTAGNESGDNLYYNAQTGQIVTGKPTNGYGQCKTPKTDLKTEGVTYSVDNNTGAVLKVSWTDKGVVSLEWTK